MISTKENINIYFTTKQYNFLINVCITLNVTNLHLLLDTEREAYQIVALSRPLPQQKVASKKEWSIYSTLLSIYMQLLLIST
jgi:hypothetical protein